jgi:hypothetical protein
MKSRLRFGQGISGHITLVPLMNGAHATRTGVSGSISYRSDTLKGGADASFFPYIAPFYKRLH